MASWWAVWYGVPLALLLSVIAFASGTVVIALSSGVSPNGPSLPPGTLWPWVTTQILLGLALVVKWFWLVRDRLVTVPGEVGGPESGASAGAIVGLLIATGLGVTDVAPWWCALCLAPVGAMIGSSLAGRGAWTSRCDS
jgi:hypothetical protein